MYASERQSVCEYRLHSSIEPSPEMRANHSIRKIKYTTHNTVVTTSHDQTRHSISSPTHHPIPLNWPNSTSKQIRRPDQFAPSARHIGEEKLTRSSSCCYRRCYRALLFRSSRLQARRAARAISPVARGIVSGLGGF